MPSDADVGSQNDAPGKTGSSKTLLKITGIFAGIGAVTLVVILPVYYSVIEPSYPPVPPESERFDCLPGEEPSRSECANRGCTWRESSTAGVPSCYFSGPRAYSLEGETLNDDNGVLTSTLRLRNTDFGNYFGQQFEKVTVQTTSVSETTLRIKIYPEGERYEVPIEHPAPEESIDSPLYTVEHTNEDGNFGVKVTREQTSSVLFDSSIGELMFADQFIQISTRVASEYIYGFGEHMHRSFKHNMNWKTYGMFTYDQHVTWDYNLYGVQTYFMCMEGNGNAYGVFFVNSNAMEVQLQPTPAITYRTIGGILDFYIFLGPSPEEVTQQYMGVVGHPYFPPYWSLGFQLCRWGYGSLEKLSQVVNRNLEAGIPYDVQYSDIDYMERQLDFTIDNDTYYGLTDFVLDLKRTNNMKYIIIIDPAISGNETDPYPTFDNGVRDDIFLKDPDGNLAWGKVWPDLPNCTVNESQPREYQIEHYRAHTAYPDFFHPNASSWWKELIIDFRDKIEFDGLWIDMNEPTSFVNGTPNNYCPENTYDFPPYVPNVVADRLYDLTICMQTLQYHPVTQKYTPMYNLHSLYGWSETLPTLEACREATGERCLVLTRSTYPGAGKYAGHWLGDNVSNWEHLRASIIGMMEYSQFGFPYNGADVCGFFEDTENELCLRWMQLGAFYPFYRNHNVEKTVDQDPAVFGEEFIANIKGVMEARYALLPYLYTLFYEASVYGSTVVRPLMHQFPNDVTTYTAERQFLWGPALLITAVLEEGATSVTGYFPQARWYNYFNGLELPETGKEIDLPTAINETNLHVLGGFILPTQEPDRNTYYSRLNPLGLIVALDQDFKANGNLFWDDGDSIGTIETGNYTLISFTCESSRLNIEVAKAPVGGLDVSSLFFGRISIFGLEETSVNSVVVDGTEDEGSGMDTDFKWEVRNEALFLTDLDLRLNVNHNITWS